LDEFEMKLALELGNDDLRLGIRRAVVLTSMRTLKINSSPPESEYY
jgi:hypothetical protein